MLSELETGGRLPICGWCPVRWQCLECALADESLSGLWGGTTDPERKLIRPCRVA